MFKILETCFINPIMDRIETIDIFIKNFVQKDRRERADYELKSDSKRGRFINKLNHTWEKVLDMSHIVRIPDGQDDYNFVKEQLGMRDNDKCYLISSYDDIDGKVLEFKDAFDNSYGRGFATIVMNLAGNKLYLETEIDYGRQNRFIGKR